MCVCLLAKWCRLLCNPMDYSPPGSSLHGIPQVRILEWVAIPFSRGSSWPKARTWVPGTAGGFFTTEPLGKPSSLYTPMLMMCTLVIQVSKKNLLIFLLLQSCFCISMLPKTFILSLGSYINSMAMNHKIKSLKHEEHISIRTLDIAVSNSACVKYGPEFQIHSIPVIWNQMA